MDDPAADLAELCRQTAPLLDGIAFDLPGGRVPDADVRAAAKLLYGVVLRLAEYAGPEPPGDPVEPTDDRPRDARAFLSEVAARMRGTTTVERTAELHRLATSVLDGFDLPAGAAIVGGRFVDARAIEGETVAPDVIDAESVPPPDAADEPFAWFPARDDG